MEKKISVRLFAWFDLLTLYRSRGQVLPLDSVLFLTHGSPISATALMFGASPRRGINMGISRSGNGGPPLVGQMRYKPGERSARMSFVAPERAAVSSEALALLDYMAGQAGAQGAYHLLAELDERHAAFEMMRRAGFSVYAWQRVWTIDLPRDTGGPLAFWRQARSREDLAVRSLYQLLTPPLVQAAEPLANPLSRMLVHCNGGEVLACVEAFYGARGIFLHPVVHPDVANVVELMADLVRHLPMRLGRPVYLAVRSYQSWLEGSLQQIDGQFGPRQALLVKHLVNPARVPAAARYAVRENPQAEPTASMVRPVHPYEKEPQASLVKPTR